MTIDPVAHRKSYDRYIRACRLAHIPSLYRFDKRWRRAQPHFLNSLIAYNDGELFRLREREQQKWFDRLQKPKSNLLREAYFIALLGDYFPDLANRVAFGLLRTALLDGLTVRAFPASAVNVPSPLELAKLDVDLPAQWQLLCVYGAHTDDCPERRQALRDFLQFHDQATRLLVVHGRDPLTYLHTVLGVNPQAILYFPAEGLKHLFRRHGEHL